MTPHSTSGTKLISHPCFIPLEFLPLKAVDGGTLNTASSSICFSRLPTIINNDILHLLFYILTLIQSLVALTQEFSFAVILFWSMKSNVFEFQLLKNRSSFVLQSV